VNLSANVGHDNPEGLSVVLIPYALLSAPAREAVFLGTNVIKVGGFEFLTR
jgi:hypothetical protein